MEFPLWLMAVFLFLLGCCVGSFLNVVIWRLPARGTPVTFNNHTAPLTLSWPPSHCPLCQQGIAWYRNIPVLGWLMLRGRCHTCQAPISARYPLVELGTGFIYLSLYLGFFYANWNHGAEPGILGGAVPMILYLVFVSCLLAASAIDADFFIIPLNIPYLIMGVSLASCIFGSPKMLPSVTPESFWGKLAIGGTLGLVFSNVLLYLQILPRSFSTPQDHSSVPESAPLPLIPPPTLKKSWPQMTAGFIIAASVPLAWILCSAKVAALVTMLAGILIFLVGVLPRPMGAPDDSQEVLDESADVNVRREMRKEILFLLPPIGLAILIAILPVSFPAWPWLARLLGVLLGLLVGGGMIWAIRILGSLIVGRVAMGAADAPLMAAIGAVVGAPAVIVAFFLAPILGLLWAVVLKFQGKPNVLPYGPWLSMAAILTLFIGQPVIHWYAGELSPTLPPRHQSTMIWPGEPVKPPAAANAKP
jgi:prepilin signal peptidase PulO-like enzyme (type II secretory pathway)